MMQVFPHEYRRALEEQKAEDAAAAQKQNDQKLTKEEVALNDDLTNEFKEDAITLEAIKNPMEAVSSISAIFMLQIDNIYAVDL